MTLRSLFGINLKDSITTVNGVGDILLGGYVDPQMRIWMNNSKMGKFQITSQDIIDAVNIRQYTCSHWLSGQRSNRTAYAGSTPEFKNAEECNNLFIPKRQGQIIWKPLPISSVAFCEEGTDEIRRISRYNGIQPTIGLGVIKQHGTNAVAIGEAVRRKIDQLRSYFRRNELGNNRR